MGGRSTLDARPSTCWRCAWLVCVLGVSALLLHGADATSAFDTANKLYEQGKYAEAATAYLNMLAAGRRSAALYFNLGNARFKSGQVGRAIAAYRQAERLAPRDPDIRANLRFARKTVTGSANTDATRWQRWLANLTVNEWTLLTSAAGWFWFLALAVREIFPHWKKALRTYTAMLGAATLLFGGCLTAAYDDEFHSQEAVVAVPEAVVRYGPLEESKSFYTARDGTELTVLAAKEDWLQVRDAAQRSGWLKREHVVLLTP